MSYHPDPHGELDWNVGVFEQLDDEQHIPQLISASFSAVMSASLHQSRAETTVGLLMVYADLAETLPERQVQLALLSAAPLHFEDVLSYADRPDLISTPATKEPHEHPEDLI